MSLSNPLRIVRADPDVTSPPRFIIAGQAGTASGDVKMYEWHRAKGDMRLSAIQSDVGQVRALSWSPGSSNLIALGLSTGRTLLLSLTPQTLSLPLIALQSSTTVPSSTVSVLPVKHVRSVTSLSFCGADPNYLATGYERHRSDYSLLIWDLSTTLPPGTNRPLYRLEVTNPLARDATRLNPSEPRHIQHYCPSEHVNDIAFLPNTYTLLASANNKAIRLYDLRTPANTGGTASPREPSHTPGAGQWNTRAVLGLSPDPTHQNRFASYETSPGGTASTVRLWDSRKISGETSSFDIKGTVIGLEWVNGGPGRASLGVGTRDGVSLWDIVDGRTVDENGSDDWVTIGGVRNLIKPKQPLHAFAFTNAAEEKRDVLFVVKDGTIGIGPANPPLKIASGARGDIALTTHNLSILDPDVHLSPASDTASDTSVDEETTRANRFQLHPSRVTDILAESSRSRTGSPASSIFGGVKGHRTDQKKVEVKVKGDKRGEELEWRDWTRVLQADVGWIMRKRAEEGYSLSNLLLNAAIVTRYPGHDRLAGIWEFIDHLSSVMDPSSSATRSLNLTYAGIHSIWTGQDLPSSPSSSHHFLSRASSHSTPREPVKQGSAAWTSLRNNQHPPMRSHSTPITSPTPTIPEIKDKFLPEVDFTAAVEHMNARRDTDEHPGKVGKSHLPPSDKIAQRRMILAVCGERDAEVNRLVQDEQRTKAASWAYFSGEEENAVRILMNSNNMKHRLFGTTLAGFLTQTRSTRASESTFFEEHWRSLVNRVDDPYLRAVLSRVGGDGWESVLEEEAIPLLDRMAVAACNLSDEELGAFIKNRLARFTRNPSPSLTSLALTGFTPPAISIMQKWLERTGDIQTIVLLSSYFPLGRVSTSERESIRRWVEAYRDLLDEWGLWGERVEFDIGHMEIGKGLGEERTADGVQQGVCPVCNNVLSKTHEEHLQLKSGLSRERSLPNERTGACALCGQTLPRCVICLRHVEPRFSTAHAHEDLEDTAMATDTLDQAYVCCLTCRHGGHANHILAWFTGGLDGQDPNESCPVVGCSCECGNI